MFKWIGWFFPSLQFLRLIFELFKGNASACLSTLLCHFLFLSCTFKEMSTYTQCCIGKSVFITICTSMENIRKWCEGFTSFCMFKKIYFNVSTVYVCVHSNSLLQRCGRPSNRHQQGTLSLTSFFPSLPTSHRDTYGETSHKALHSSTGWVVPLLAEHKRWAVWTRRVAATETHLTGSNSFLSIFLGCVFYVFKHVRLF